MTRRLGGFMGGVIPRSTQKDGVWTLKELSQILASTQWHPVVALTANTFSTANAGSYTFTAQAVGDADDNKSVFVFVAASSGSTGATAVTIGGSAATALVSAIGTSGISHAQLFSARIQSATTTADVVVTYGATQSRCVAHVYSAFGVDYPLATQNSTTVAITTGSSGESFSVDIPMGGFAITGAHRPGSLSTYGIVTGATVTAVTTISETAAGLAVTGVTDPTTTFRLGHSITTTHSTGASAAACAFVAVIK